MLLPHPNTKFARGGLTIPAPLQIPASKAGVQPIPVDAQGTRPQLPDILPELDHRLVYADEIVLPANTLFGPTASNLSAVYCMESLRIPGDVGEELSLVGVDVELLPTDSAGALATTSLGAASSTAWGKTDGTAGAVVVGQSLGIPRKTWAGLAVYYPGVELTSLDLDSPQKPVQYFESVSFPTGKLNDTTPNKLFLPKSYLPTHKPITQGNSLDVLLCVRRSQLAADAGGTMSSGGAAKAVLCHIRVLLRLMKTLRYAPWRR